MYWFLAILIIPYLFLLLKIYRSLIRIKSFNITSDPSTFVSVVVACHNEQENLHALISSINGQNYSKKLFEVILVDDNSGDSTYKISLRSAKNSNITAVKSKGKGKKQAIRTGINASSGALIITTDADCIMGKSWIRTIASFFVKHSPDMIICPVKLKPGKDFFRRFQELEFLSLQGITAGSASSGKGTMCNGANLAFTRKAYLNHSGNLHDEIASGDDIFLLHNLKKHSNLKILWLESNDAMVTANSSPTIISFLKQRRRWISKGKSYNDLFTILLATVTFVTIVLQLLAMVAGFFYPAYWWFFLIIFLLKSLPDLLILKNRTHIYDRKKLMRWFLPSQIVYPFYVLGVLIYALIIPEQLQD